MVSFSSIVLQKVTSVLDTHFCNVSCLVSARRQATQAAPELVEVFIDDRPVLVEPGTTVLQVRTILGVGDVNFNYSIIEKRCHSRKLSAGMYRYVLTHQFNHIVVI